MRTLCLRTALLATLLGVSQVLLAQMPPVPAPTATSPKLNLTLEQRYTIREIIKDLKAERVSSDVHIAPGEPAPANVSLQPIPPEIAQKVPQVKSHKFFVTSDEIVIVDPKDNVVAEVVKTRAD
jgi:hypothetical protein